METVHIVKGQITLPVRLFRRIFSGERLIHFRRMMNKSQCLYVLSTKGAHNTLLFLSSFYFDNAELCHYANGSFVIPTTHPDGPYDVDASCVVVTSGTSVSLTLHHGKEKAV